MGQMPRSTEVNVFLVFEMNLFESVRHTKYVANLVVLLYMDRGPGCAPCIAMHARFILAIRNNLHDNYALG